MKDIKTRLLTMLRDSSMTDALFIVQGQEIRCHNLILNSCENKLKNLVAANPKKVDIDDVSPDTFQAILRYLYADEFAVTDENVFHVMYAAEKFGLDDFVQFCSEFISNKLTEINVGLFTSQALQFDAKEYLKVFLDYFKCNTCKVLDTDSFLEIPVNVLSIFGKNRGSNCSESEFFTSCFEWAKAECKRQNLAENRENWRSVLGKDVLEQFQFQDTTLKEFQKIVGLTKLLTREEIGCYLERLLDDVQVTITDHTNTPTSLTLSSSTTIRSLKKRAIWDGGSKSYPASEFTLSCNRKRLQDDDTLFDLPFAEGSNSVSLEIDSFNIVLKDCYTNTQQTCSLNSLQLRNMDSNQTYAAIKPYIPVKYLHYNSIFRYSSRISTDLVAINKEQWPSPRAAELYPGCVVYYKYY